MTTAVIIDEIKISCSPSLAYRVEWLLNFVSLFQYYIQLFQLFLRILFSLIRLQHSATFIFSQRIARLESQKELTPNELLTKPSVVCYVHKFIE